MLNHICIMGRLTKDPELRRTKDGKPVTSFSIAVKRDFGGETDFYDCVAFTRTAEFVDSYFTKGRTAIVSGHLQTRAWETKDGQKRKIVEIVAEDVYFGDKKEERPEPKAMDITPAADWEQMHDDDGHLPF